MAFYDGYQGSFFNAQVETRFGTGYLVGKGEDNDFLVSFSSETLTLEGKEKYPNAHNPIFFVKEEDIYRFVSTELIKKENKKNGIQTKRTKTRKQRSVL